MNNSANSNMLFYAIDSAWERYRAHLSGNHMGLFCVISNTALEDVAIHALEASLEKLEYGKNACTFISRYSQTDAPSPLSSQELAELIEMLDPSLLIITDAESTHAVGEIYRTSIALQSFCHVDGRATVAFNSFPGMLDNSEDKQRAWALLKRLAR